MGEFDPLVMRTVAIAGYASSSRLEINAEPPETQVWGLNRSYEFLDRYDGYFQIHPRNWHGDKRGLYGRPEEHMQFLMQCKVPVWMLYPDERVPAAQLYPRAEVVRMFGRDYLQSSFAYCLGLALLQGVDVVKFFGTELATYDEYLHQRPNLEYMIGWAEARGVRIELPDDCLLLRGPAYPEEAMHVKAIERRMVMHKSEYMAAYVGFVTATGMARAFRKVGRLDLASRHDSIAGRFGVQTQERKGMMKEAQVRLQEMGLTDITSVMYPGLMVPPEFEDNGPVLDEQVIQVPG